MSYKNYTGTVSARGGKGEDAPQCHADISKIIPVGLSSQDLLEKLIKKYGIDIIATIAWNQYKIVIQKAGQAVLKDDPKATDKAAQAIVDRANSDLTPQRRVAAPRITAVSFREAAKAAGVPDKKIEETLAKLLESAE